MLKIKTKGSWAEGQEGTLREIRTSPDREQGGPLPAAGGVVPTVAWRSSHYPLGVQRLHLKYPLGTEVTPQYAPDCQPFLGFLVRKQASSVTRGQAALTLAPQISRSALPGAF